MSKTFVSFIFAVLLVSFALFSFISAAPVDYPTEKTVVTIEEGSSLSKAAKTLFENRIIKSEFAYKVLVVLLGGQKKIIAGDYLFDTKQTAYKVAYRTINGEQGIKRIKITIPEGIASYDIARLLEKNIPNFDSKKFLELARPEEGYLFPDTYFIYENATPEKVVAMMKENFEKKIKSVELSIERSGRSFEEVLIMSSIVEKEANKSDDRKIIAGILWKRYDTDHLLQVDAPFFYTLGKDSSKLTMSDLGSASPYNTYKHLGLPPTPINNPGLEAILDTINYKETKYWFYLADSKGVTHYAVDHDGHLANRDKYIQ